MAACRAAAVGRALDRLLKARSSLAQVSRIGHSFASQSGAACGSGRPERLLLPALRPWESFVRAFSESSGSGAGDGQQEGGNGGREALESPAERPEVVSAQGSGSGGGQSTRDSGTGEDLKTIGEDYGRFADADENVVQRQQWPASPPTGSAAGNGPVRLDRAQNSQGPVDYGERLANVTDDELDNLIALKNFKGIRGLPPLDVILAQDDEQEKKAKRREAERRKQEEIQKTRVKQVDDFGRAYATGKRKRSIARVWLKEGHGSIVINGKTHDLYFLDMDQRVQLLEPFLVTDTLGGFDVRSTVKGGGISGQAGALRHGISKALQLFNPSLRPLLKSEGMLTRDDRIVERKKPGKAKARKSFQWVKR